LTASASLTSTPPDAPGRPRRVPSVALLDIDGTLIDSNDAHARSWADTFRELGYDVPFDRVRPLIGMGGDKLLAETVGVEHESAEGKRLSERRRAVFTERYLPGLRPFPGARQLLERMRAAGLILVVATSAGSEELDGLLRAAGVHDLLDAATTSSDAERSKPDPDIIEAALARAGCDASEALMVGDTPYDVQAARRAGVATVALRSGGWDGDALAGALAIYDDAADLLARFATSPFTARSDDVPPDDAPARTTG
jgi:HAD superfamily hydrolase (TIGR01509 family)